jgi:hypothetical protein
MKTAPNGSLQKASRRKAWWHLPRAEPFLAQELPPGAMKTARNVSLQNASRPELYHQRR